MLRLRTRNSAGSSLFPIVLACLSCLVFSTARAQNAPAKPFRAGDPAEVPAAAPSKPKAPAEATVAPSPAAAPTQEIDVPIPIGQDVRGIRIPNFNEKGELSMEIEAEVARKVEDRLIEMEGLHVKMVDAEDKSKVDVQMEKAVFNLDNRILNSDTQTTIKREDFEIIGDTAEFDTKTRYSKMVGNVKMTIFSMDRYQN